MATNDHNQSNSNNCHESDDFIEAYPYLAEEYKREYEYQATLGVFSDLAVREALKALPNLKPHLSRMGDNFLD